MLFFPFCIIFCYGNLKLMFAADICCNFLSGKEIFGFKAYLCFIDKIEYRRTCYILMPENLLFFLHQQMAAKPLSTEAIALTEKKMDMTLG